MNSLIKKSIIYSIVGIMQFGTGASVLEAAAQYQDDYSLQQYESRYDSRDRRHYDERRRHHDRRLEEENRRHEREMRRRPHESERQWHRRQRHERERHDHALREIAALLIGIAIGSADK